MVVEFMDGSGNIYQSISLDAGSEIPYPTPPIKEGYMFKGWSENTNVITNSMRIVPLFELLEITVTFDYGHKEIIRTIQALTDLSEIDLLSRGNQGFYLDPLETTPLNRTSLVTDTTIYVSPHLDQSYYNTVVTRGNITYYLPEFAQMEPFDTVYQVGNRIDDLPIVSAGSKLFEGWMAGGEILTLPFDLESSAPMHLIPVFSDADVDYFYYTEEGTFLENPSTTNIIPYSNLTLDYIYFWPDLARNSGYL